MLPAPNVHLRDFLRLLVLLSIHEQTYIILLVMAFSFGAMLPDHNMDLGVFVGAVRVPHNVCDTCGDGLLLFLGQKDDMILSRRLCNRSPSTMPAQMGYFFTT